MLYYLQIALTVLVVPMATTLTQTIAKDTSLVPMATPIECHALQT